MLDTSLETLWAISAKEQKESDIERHRHKQTYRQSDPETEKDNEAETQSPGSLPDSQHPPQATALDHELKQATQDEY